KEKRKNHCANAQADGIMFWYCFNSSGGENLNPVYPAVFVWGSSGANIIKRFQHFIGEFPAFYWLKCIVAAIVPDQINVGNGGCRAYTESFLHFSGLASRDNFVDGDFAFFYFHTPVFGEGEYVVCWVAGAR